MKTATALALQQEVETTLIVYQSAFTPLELETRTAINTSEAAYHLNRKKQTLRQ